MGINIVESFMEIRNKLRIGITNIFFNGKVKLLVLVSELVSDIFDTLKFIAKNKK